MYVSELILYWNCKFYSDLIYFDPIYLVESQVWRSIALILKRMRLGFGVLLLIALTPVWGDEEDTEVTHHHDHDLIEEIVVHAHMLGGGERAQNVTILYSEELERVAKTSIGETLGSTLGVHSSSFGPMIGRLVINGLGETRVLVLENHHGTMDASSTGADHGVGVEPFLADTIEILKGSGTLLYGSGAIGGAVDVHTNRVPTSLPEAPLTGRALVRWDGASNGRYGGFRLDGGEELFAWHVDAYANKHRDLSIPGYAQVSPHVEMHHEEEEEEDHHDDEGMDEHVEADEAEESSKGLLENSFGEFTGGSIGGALIFDHGHFGVALIRRDWKYGLVAHDHGADEHEEEEDDHLEEEDDHLEEDHGQDAGPWLDLNQTRVQADFGLHDPLPGFEAMEGSFIVSDYEHYEIEGDGEVATYFSNESWEGRLILETQEFSQWSGALGLQFGQRDQGFSTDKASSNPSESQHFAVFGVAQRQFKSFELESGARIERFNHQSPDGMSSAFLATSISFGAVFFPDDKWHIRLWGDYAMRAPQSEELFSDNPHLATRGFERGNPDLDEEEALNLSFGVEYDHGRLHFAANIFRYSFDNYIYQQVTEETMHGLPVIQWVQSEATLFGGDLAASLDIFQPGAALDGKLSFGYDMVRTDLNDPHEKYLPRSPANRVFVAAEVVRGNFWARLSYTHVFDHGRSATRELMQVRTRSTPTTLAIRTTTRATKRRRTATTTLTSKRSTRSM